MQYLKNSDMHVKFWMETDINYVETTEQQL